MPTEHRMACGARALGARSPRSTAEQIAFALRQAEEGNSVLDVCRKMGIAKQTFCRWKKKFLGMGVAGVRRLKVLEEENRKLKQLVADLRLDKQMLQDVRSTPSFKSLHTPFTIALARTPTPAPPPPSYR